MVDGGLNKKIVHTIASHAQKGQHVVENAPQPSTADH
jgi:hypothetical protein